ncbi:MAG: ATP-binding protein [Elusimicrobiota bacterium]
MARKLKSRVVSNLVHMSTFPELNPNPIIEINYKCNQVLYLNPAIKQLFPDIEEKGANHPWFKGLKQRKGFKKNKDESIYRYIKIKDLFYKQNIYFVNSQQVMRIYGENITERMHFYETMRNSELRFRRLFETAQDGILILHANTGRITEVNPFLIDMLGYSRKEFLGKRLWEIGLIQDIDASRRAFSELQNKSYIRYEHLPLKTKNGKVVDVEFVSNIYSVGHNKVIQCNIRNITDRKKIEKKLEVVYKNLENKVRQRTMELQKTNIQLSQEIQHRKQTEIQILNAQKELLSRERLSAVGTLAATVAHELRNPLAAIQMATYNIRRKAQNPLLDKHLENIEKKILESDRIINNLLFYSRIKEPQYEKLNIYKIINECAISMKKQVQNKKIEVYKVLDSIRNISVEADPFQVKEVLINLLNNACDAVSSKKGTIEIVAGLEGKFLKIDIIDNGSGIEDADLHRVFDPFFTTKAKGTGLGLSVCMQIINQHNGRMDIKSQKDKGTTFTIRLPLERSK